MKFCPFCGYSVENVYSFCPKCGHSIPDVNTKAPQKEKSIRSTDLQNEPAPAASRSRWEMKNEIDRTPVNNNRIYDAGHIEQPAEKTVIIEDNSGGFGWWLLGFFFPVVGLLIYLNAKDSKPGRAHSSASGAFTILILLAIAAALFLFGVTKGYISLV